MFVTSLYSRGRDIHVGRSQFLRQPKKTYEKLIDHLPRSTTKRMAFFGLIGAALMQVASDLMRALGFTSVDFARGLSGSLFHASLGFLGWTFGFIWHLSNGVLLAFVLRKILMMLKWDGFREGAILGFAYWFIASILVGTFPSLDVITAAGVSKAGPFGVFLGKPTFYLLLGGHLAFGAMVGWGVRISSHQDQKFGSNLIS